MWNKATIVVVLAAGLLFPQFDSMAQTTNATIVGDLTDPQGSAIPGAAITVKNVATGVARSTVTNEFGSYRVFPLNPGTYEVTASASGFKTKVQSDVVLDAASIVKVDFQLEVGQITETVEVTAASTLLQTQEASVGGTVTGNEVARLPVNGRNYTRLILLLPGTSDVGLSQSRGEFSGTQLISVNGQRRQDNNFTVDGVDNNFMMMNSPGGSPPMDSIQEFRVLENTSAEFGRSAGANVNVVIKSGTRDLHGSFYEYLRNDKFDANDFFANRQGTGKVPFRQNQYGFTLPAPPRQHGDQHDADPGPEGRRFLAAGADHLRPIHFDPEGGRQHRPPGIPGEQNPAGAHQSRYPVSDGHNVSPAEPAGPESQLCKHRGSAQ
jgi:hypothetical protein